MGAMMGKLLLCVLVFGSVVFGQSPPNPQNSALIFEDSVRVVGTGVYRLPVFWVDRGLDMSVLVEGMDTSQAGFANDSAVLDTVRVFQVFPVSSVGPFGSFVRVRSRAHPDSTTGNGGSDWVLVTGLNAKTTMDTASVYRRNRLSGVMGAGISKFASGDSLVSQNQTGYGAFWYAKIQPNFSPALSFELTGGAANRKGAGGSKWRIRVYQLQSLNTK
jgi:hypothetical protein